MEPPTWTPITKFQIVDSTYPQMPNVHLPALCTKGVGNEFLHYCDGTSQLGCKTLAVAKREAGLRNGIPTEPQKEKCRNFGKETGYPKITKEGNPKDEFLLL